MLLLYKAPFLPPLPTVTFPWLSFLYFQLHHHCTASWCPISSWRVCWLYVHGFNFFLQHMIVPKTFHTQNVPKHINHCILFLTLRLTLSKHKPNHEMPLMALGSRAFSVYLHVYLYTLLATCPYPDTLEGIILSRIFLCTSNINWCLQIFLFPFNYPFDLWWFGKIPLNL